MMRILVSVSFLFAIACNNPQPSEAEKKEIMTALIFGGLDRQHPTANFCEVVSMTHSLTLDLKGEERTSLLNLFEMVNFASPKGIYDSLASDLLVLSALKGAENEKRQLAALTKLKDLLPLQPESLKDLNSGKRIQFVLVCQGQNSQCAAEELCFAYPADHPSTPGEIFLRLDDRGVVLTLAEKALNP